MNLYITADEIGQVSGGGAVTYHESEALKTLGPCQVWGRDQLSGAVGDDPWLWDEYAKSKQDWFVLQPRLAHFYAGTFTQTIDVLKRNGCKVTYTAAAHSIPLSYREHELLDIPFNYPHLTIPALWQRYVGGYLAADVLMCPSRHSAQVMQSYGYNGRIEIIPHGCHVPEQIPPLPAGPFTVGYLGALGPDKGVQYLLQAWAKLNYQDGSRLVIAGAHSHSPWAIELVHRFHPHNPWRVHLLGWQKTLGDFFGQIHVYVQPSITEGFGCEVLEAMAHGRPVLCSKGAGAVDLVDDSFRFEAANVDELAGLLHKAKQCQVFADEKLQILFQQKAQSFTWDKIRQRYVDLWRSLL